MRQVKLTRLLAWSAATDAGNRSMRAAGREAWDETDYNAAVAEFERLWPIKNEMEGNRRSPMDINDINSAGIQAFAQENGITEATLVGRGSFEQANATLYRIGDALVLDTNADPVFEGDQGFDETLAQYGIDDPRPLPQDILDTFTAWCKEADRSEGEVSLELAGISTEVMRLSTAHREQLVEVWRTA